MRYDYKCNVCGGQQEIERSIHAEADSPICCQQSMTRLYSAPPVKFNGTGYYSTDNPKR
jgi:putative FmdB family regulatory protein